MTQHFCLSLLNPPFIGLSFKNGLSFDRYETGSGNLVKVLTLLEACLDLISGSSLHMKIQIMGGKITENLGFKSPLRNVKTFFFIFKPQIFSIFPTHDLNFHVKM